MHGAKVSYLKFHNVKVGRENLVGGLNQGLTILLDELDRERPAVAAGMLGIARASFAAAVQYSTRHSQFGKPIRSFQGVSFKIADMAAKFEASRLLILQAARALDVKKPVRKLGAIAKLFATEQPSKSPTRPSKSMRNRLHERHANRTLLPRRQVHDDRRRNK